MAFSPGRSDPQGDPQPALTVGFTRGAGWVMWVSPVLRVSAPLHLGVPPGVSHWRVPRPLLSFWGLCVLSGPMRPPFWH